MFTNKNWIDRSYACSSLLLVSAILSLITACAPATQPSKPTPDLTEPASTQEASSSAVLVVSGEYAPYVSEHLPNYGLVTEIITAAFAEMEQTPTYEFYPWLRAEQAVQAGDAWGVYPYFYTEERAEIYAYSETLIEAPMPFFYYKPNTDPVEWELLEDLRSYSVIGVLGYFYQDDFMAAELNAEYVSSEESALRMLQAGRGDFLPLDLLVGRSLIQEHFPDEADNFAILDNPLTVSPSHVMVLKNDPESLAILAQFNEALQKIKANGTYDEILERYEVDISAK